MPEGVYALAGLNPNSTFHLSIKVDYPNAFDREKARGDGRTNLGGDIFIHGASSSIGCLAMGDPAIEELFVLVADVGFGNTQLIVAPYDLRTRERPGISTVSWANELYDTIEIALKAFPPSVATMP